MNLFAYTKENPINEIDILGLDETKWFGGGRSILDGPRNGNWGGRNWSGGHNPEEYGGYSGGGLPTDSGDQCYMEHDICYYKCLKKYDWPSNRCEDQELLSECKIECDMKLVNCLMGLPNDPRNWAFPPKEGTEEDSARFRDWAIMVFSPTKEQRRDLSNIGVRLLNIVVNRRF
jgi:hypothetical protein